MKKPINYALILAEFPETEKLFSDAEEAAEPAAEEPESSEETTEEEEIDLGPFDADAIKASMLPHLKHQDMDEFKTQEGDEYEIQVESLGSEEGAKEKLGAEDAKEILSLGQEFADRIADAAGLPGRFELRADETEPDDDAGEPETQYNLYFCWSEDDVESLRELAEKLPDAGLDEHPAQTPEQHSEEPGPEAEEPEANEDLLDESDFEDVELDPSFDEIMSSLADEGHIDLAESLYQILYAREN